MIKTYHKYVKQVTVKKTDTALILGTIHPHETDKFLIDFFYGNRNSIWNILDLVFPETGFKSKEMILKNLSKNKVWISDIILSCERQNERITQDSLLQNIEPNTDQIQDGIENSKINEIFFTSGFGKNNTAKLFCDTFSIIANLNENRTFEIPEQKFGRRIQGIVLFSPSGQANIGISNNQKYLTQKKYYKKFEKPIKEFKVDCYRKAFQKQFS